MGFIFLVRKKTNKNITRTNIITNLGHENFWFNLLSHYSKILIQDQFSKLNWKWKTQSNIIYKTYLKIFQSIISKLVEKNKKGKISIIMPLSRCFLFPITDNRLHIIIKKRYAIFRQISRPCYFNDIAEKEKF